MSTYEFGQGLYWALLFVAGMLILRRVNKRR